MDILPQDNTPRKQCTGPCGRLLPYTLAFFHSNGKGTLRPQCKDCSSQRGKELYKRPEVQQRARAYAQNYRAENSTHVRTHKKEYYSKPEVKTQKLLYTREYRTRPEVLEKKRVKGREYANRPEVRERRRPYERTYQHNRRARMKQNGGSHTAQDIQDQLKRQRGKCYYCRKKLTTYQIDHVVPSIRGGSNDISNIVLACPPCNQRKNDRLPHEWPEGGRLL